MYNKYQRAVFDKNKPRMEEEQRQALSVHLPDFLTRVYGFQFIVTSNNYKTATGYDHFRVFQADSGYWCLNWDNGEDVKDAIVAIIDIEKLNGNTVSYGEAIHIILGTQSTNPVKHTITSTKPQTEKKLEIYYNEISDQEETELNQYIMSRGIEMSTWDAAVAQGFCGKNGSYIISKTSNGINALKPHCIRFLGLDENGTIRSSDQRFIHPLIDSTGKEVFKMCEGGSKKEFAPILLGDLDSNEIHIVEGGFSALGLREIHKRLGVEPIPTIIMSGGRAMQKFIETTHIKLMLEQALRIVIWVENEFVSGTTEINEMKQPGTVQAANKLKEKIEVINKAVKLEPVPSSYSDTADWNLNEK